MKSTPDLVVVGAASRDVTQDDGRGWRLGGSATYVSLTAARQGIRVGCVLGVDAEAGAAAELTMLREAGVELELRQLEHGPVFTNTEHDGHRTQGWSSKSDRIPLQLPLGWQKAPLWLLVPVAGEVGPDWAAAPSSEAIVGAGWQGMLRAFDDDGFVRPIAPERSDILARAEVVVASLDDVGGTVSIAELRGCLGARSLLVLTAGRHGGIALGRDEQRLYPAIPSQAEVEPTGAGDVFIASFVASHLLLGSAWTTERALRLSAAAASCSVEGVGLEGVPTAAQVAERLLLGARPT